MAAAHLGDCRGLKGTAGAAARATQRAAEREWLRAAEEEVNSKERRLALMRGRQGEEQRGTQSIRVSYNHYRVYERAIHACLFLDYT